MATATLEELSNQHRSKKIDDDAETKETELDVLGFFLFMLNPFKTLTSNQITNHLAFTQIIQSILV